MLSKNYKSLINNMTLVPEYLKGLNGINIDIDSKYEITRQY